eukprot:Awhi_evm1s14417
MFRNTVDSHVDKPSLQEAVLVYQQIAESSARVRKLKEFERSVLLSDVEGLAPQFLPTLGNLEYYINVLSPSSKDNSLRERVVLVFREVVLILNKFYKTKSQYKLRDKLPLSSVTCQQYDEGDYDYAFALFSNNKLVLIGTCNSATERDETISAIYQSAGMFNGRPDVVQDKGKKTLFDTFKSLRKKQETMIGGSSSNNNNNNCNSSNNNNSNISHSNSISNGNSGNINRQPSNSNYNNNNNNNSNNNSVSNNNNSAQPPKSPISPQHTQQPQQQQQQAPLRGQTSSPTVPIPPTTAQSGASVRPSNSMKRGNSNPGAGPVNVGELQTTVNLLKITVENLQREMKVLRENLEAETLARQNLEQQINR